MNINNVILALILVVAVVLVPATSPQLAQSVGGVFAAPLQFVTSLLQTIFEGLSQFEGDMWQFLLAAGISSPLTFAVVAFLKRFSFLSRFGTQTMAVVVGFALYVVMLLAQNAGQFANYESGVQIAVLLLSLFAGAGATQFGASTIHERLVAGSFAMAQPRNEA